MARKKGNVEGEGEDKENRLPIRFKDEDQVVREALEQAAADNRRSANAEAISLIEEALRRRGYLPERNPPPKS